MAEAGAGERELLTLLAAGEYRTEERMMLSVRVLRGEKVLSEDLALNDAVISKGSMARVAEVEVWADQTLVQRIMGDGVIVATPTVPPPTPCRRVGPLWSPPPVSDRHAGVRPPAGCPALVLEPNRRVVGSAAPGEPETPVSVGRWRQGVSSGQRRCGGAEDVQLQDPSGTGDGAELL